MLKDTTKARAQIIQTCQALAHEGLIAGSSGNVSMRLMTDQVLATPSGAAKGELVHDALVRIDLQGRTVDDNRRRPSSEIKVHLHIYKAMREVAAVVHAHPITATALADLDGLNLCVTAEGAASLGPLAQIAYMRPGTIELAKLCARAVQDGAVTLLLGKHGAVCVGRSLDEARFRMSSLEHVAKIWLAMKAAGTLCVLNEEEVRALRQQAGLDDTWPSHARRYEL